MFTLVFPYFVECLSQFRRLREQTKSLVETVQEEIEVLELLLKREAMENDVLYTLLNTLPEKDANLSSTADYCHKILHACQVELTQFYEKRVEYSQKCQRQHIKLTRVLETNTIEDDSPLSIYLWNCLSFFGPFCRRALSIGQTFLIPFAVLLYLGATIIRL